MAKHACSGEYTQLLRNSCASNTAKRISGIAGTGSTAGPSPVVKVSGAMLASSNADTDEAGMIAYHAFGFRGSVAISPLGLAQATPNA